MSVAAPVIEFVTAVPGFPDARSWSLAPLADDPGTPLLVMSSMDVDGLEFVVVPPHIFFPDYELDLDDGTVQALGIEAPEDVVVYVVLTVGASLQDTTANLLGPVVINQVNNRAAQTVLDQPGLSARTPLTA